MDNRTRTLRQERAILTALQGDPAYPGSCTLFARRNRLQAELAQAESERAGTRGPLTARFSEPIQWSDSRATALIERDIRKVEDEIDAVRQKIAAIDHVIATEESRRTGVMT